MVASLGYVGEKQAGPGSCSRGSSWVLLALSCEGVDLTSDYVHAPRSCRNDASQRPAPAHLCCCIGTVSRNRAKEKSSGPNSAEETANPGQQKGKRERACTAFPPVPLQDPRLLTAVTPPSMDDPTPALLCKTKRIKITALFIKRGGGEELGLSSQLLGSLRLRDLEFKASLK